MKRIIFIISIVTAGLFMSCEVTEFDLQDNPSKLTPDKVSPDYLLNEVQYQFQLVMREMIRNVDDVMRYETMAQSYSDIVDVNILSGEWTNFYSMRNNVTLLQELVAENEDYKYHGAMAKVLMGYVTATMVDYIGDIPYSEANKADEVLYPKADDSSTIYAAVLADLDMAVIEFQNVNFAPLNDLFYDGDETKWITFARSLKLRMLLQTRLVDSSVAAQINALIAGGDLIDSGSEDFVFGYSTEVDPDSRHFYFERGYSTNGASEYIGNNFMWMLKDSKPVSDPRLRYYIYRQTDRDLVAEGMVDCVGDPMFDYCYIGENYYGRDHNDTSSRPNDRFLKATYGLYPGGGAFDADNFVSGQATENLGGAGILPLLMSSYMYFLQAESALMLGTTGDPAALLEDGIRASIDKVTNFSAVDGAFAATPSDIEAYVLAVNAEYTAAVNNEEKLDIIIREYYLAGFGNSIEAYNSYRRTGYPSVLQSPIMDESIPFPRNFVYPEDATSNNQSLDPNATTDQVFWDNNAPGFID